LVASPLGPLRVGAVAAGICLLEFDDPERIRRQCDALARWLGAPIVPGNHAHLDRVESELDGYFSGKLRRFTVPVVAPGTKFQTSVWSALATIPHGATWSYAELAARVGSPGAQRAVGSANGANRVAIVIPCHRVVNAGGKLGGYGGGTWRKHWLLELEKRGA
jgi:AraC family transcriptional regulator of adaptative response/methylated-DNA-[protein]-cysteine methyltransferase